MVSDPPSPTLLRYITTIQRIFRGEPLVKQLEFTHDFCILVMENDKENSLYKANKALAIVDG